MTTTKALAEALRLAREWFSHEDAGKGPQAFEVVNAADEALALFDAQAAEQAAGGGEAVAYPACPQEIVNAITAYGDARADQDANGAPTTSPMRLADCIGLIRAALYTHPELSDVEIDALRSDLAGYVKVSSELATENEALLRDAERYRCWRDAMLSADARFNRQIAAALPAAAGTERRPTAAEWDAAIDAALAERGEKR